MPLFKNYVAVQFTNMTHAVVPCHWIFKERGVLKCKWPSDGEGDPDLLCRNNTFAKEDWPIYKVKNILTDSSKNFIIGCAVFL